MNPEPQDPAQPPLQQPESNAVPAAAAAAPAPAAAAPATAAPRRTPVIPLVAALAVGALVGGVSGAGVAFWASSSNTGGPVTSNDLPVSVTVNDANDANLITAVAASASPSVVTLSVVGAQGGGTGSGVILSADGYVLTNTHVVTLDGSAADPTIQVTANDGRVYDATIVGTDPTTDLAVIKLADASDMQPIEFADSSKLNVGDTAIAIGAPLGLAGTVTYGIVSALNRSITIASSAAPEQSDGSQGQQDQQGQQGQGPFDFFQFDVPGQSGGSAPTSSISLSVIQTDATINPGNSGGALLDSDGKLIGINVAIASSGSNSGGQGGSIGIGFAIPSNLAQRIADELVQNGTATHGLLGASVVDATSDPQANAEVVGALIKELTQGGAAEAAGLQVGDIVTKFNGLPITGSTDLTAQVRALPAGASAELVYVRDGEARTVEVTLGQLQ